MGERREGLRVETPASADRQTALPKRASDPGCLNLPAEDEGREGGNSGAPVEEEEWEGLEEITLRPEEEVGQNEEGEEGGLSPP